MKQNTMYAVRSILIGGVLEWVRVRFDIILALFVCNQLCVFTYKRIKWLEIGRRL